MAARDSRRDYKNTPRTTRIEDVWLRDVRCSQTAKLVLYALAGYVGTHKEKKCWPAWSELASACCCSVNTVKAGARELERLGYLSKRRPGNRQYEFTIHTDTRVSKSDTQNSRSDCQNTTARVSDHEPGVSKSDARLSEFDPKDNNKTDAGSAPLEGARLPKLNEDSRADALGPEGAAPAPDDSIRKSSLSTMREILDDHKRYK